MGTTTKIEWCDHSASPWHGCSKVHAGCDNCYAEAMARRNPGTLGIWGDEGTRVKSKSFIANLRKWNREAAAKGVTESVFPSICDPFEDRPELADWRREMFAVADECPNIRLLLLTKRPENVPRLWPAIRERGTHRILGTRRENVWIGTSVSNQPTADEAIRHLLKLRDLTPVLFVSAEPLLEGIDLASAYYEAMVADGWHPHHHGLNDCPNCCAGENQDDSGFDCSRCYGTTKVRGIDWVIVGGESGPDARPCSAEWIRSIVQQCKTAGTACFVKQLGANVRTREPFSHVSGDVTKPHHLSDGFGNFSVALKDSKGGDWNEWPDDLRVRQFPKGS